VLTPTRQSLAPLAIAPLADELDEVWESEATRQPPVPVLEHVAYRLAMRKAAKRALHAVRA